MKLWTRLTQGLAALLLSAAALSLLFLTGAVLLCAAAAGLLALAGLYLAAPDDARKGMKALAGAMSRAAERFSETVDEAGRIFLACFGRRNEASQAEESAKQKASASAEASAERSPLSEESAQSAQNQSRAG